MPISPSVRPSSATSFFLWINGRALHQLETVKPEVPVLHFGLGNTQGESKVRAKLKIILGEEDG
jgi:hypothetical protein